MFILSLISVFWSICVIGLIKAAWLMSLVVICVDVVISVVVVLISVVGVMIVVGVTVLLGVVAVSLNWTV